MASVYMRQRQRSIDAASARLIAVSTTITDTSSDAFKQCSAFVQSNFKHHRFLDADEHRLRRVYAGLVETLRIRSQDAQAARLKASFDRFVALPLSPSANPGSDTHMSMLQLLLSCSGASASSTDALPTSTPNPLSSDDEESVDWKEELHEDDSQFDPCDTDSEDWSDLDDDAQTRAHTPPPFQPNWNTTTDVITDDSFEFIPTKHAPLEQRDNEAADASAATNYQHIQRQVPTYFQSETNISTGASNVHTPTHTQTHTSSDTLTPSQRLIASWMDVQRESNPFFHTEVVDESAIVRECVWLLCGSTASYLFSVDAQAAMITPRTGLASPHLTPECMLRLLKPVCVAATHVHLLIIFINHFTKHSSPFGRSRVFQAFASAVQTYLQAFSTEMSQFERNNSSLSAFVLKTKNHFKQISSLEGVVQHVYWSNQQSSHPLAYHTTRLLNYLHTLATDQSNASSLTHPQEVAFVHLYIHTLRPYLRCLDNWITLGETQDDADEFMIATNQNAEDWHHHHVLRASGNSDDMHVGSVRFHPRLIPKIFHPHLHKILVSGRSAHAVCALAKPLFRMDATESTCASLCDSLNLTSIASDIKSLSLGTHARECDTDFLSNALDEESALIAGHFDELVWRANTATRTDTYAPTNQTAAAPQLHASAVHSLSALGGVPLDITLQQCIAQRVHTAYTQSSARLMHMLFEDFQLKHHFEALKGVFLMAAGDCMHDFTSQLFAQMVSREGVHASELNALLTACLRVFRHDLIDEFEVHVTHDASKQMLANNTFDGVSITYKATWPVSLLLDEHVLRNYNMVFAFLLKLKRAKWSLDSIHIKGQQSAMLVNKHKVHLLRSKIQHFINSLHAFIMTRILHSLGLEFDEKLQKTRDFSEVLALHVWYSNTVTARCLLGDKATYIRDAIARVLMLALKFRTLWDYAHTSATTQQDFISLDMQFKQLDDEFTKCCNFFVSILNTLLKSGGLQHLEVLVDTLGFNAATVYAPLWSN